MLIKKKLCLIIPSLEAGGMERVMSQLADFLCAKNDLEVHLILYSIECKIFYSLPCNLNIHKPLYKFNIKFRLWFTIKTMFFLRKTIKIINPDSVLSFGEYWNNFVLIALYGLKYPIFISDRCSPQKRLVKYHNLLRKILYPKADGVIVQTFKAKQIYQHFIESHKLKVIGNPIRKITGSSDREKIILMVSRIIKTKNHDRLIKIFSKLNSTEWRLVFVGGESQKQKNIEDLKYMSLKLNVEDRVFFEGEQKNVDNYYLKSSIFAFTSSSEGFPNVIGEALSAGLPVISYNCNAGPSEMIVDGVNGFLVPVFDDDLFLKKLQLLIDDEELRSSMSQNAINSIEKYSINTIGEDFKQFILNEDTSN